MISARYYRMLLWLALAIGIPAHGASDWSRPANELAERIAAILGPGQAQLTVRNLSTLPAQEVAPIRRMIEAGLKGHGLLLSGAESANSIRITLSENARDRIWIAEIAEGNQTRVLMVTAGPIVADQLREQASIQLQAVPMVFAARSAGEQMSHGDGEPILAVLESEDGVLMLHPESVEFYMKTPSGLTLKASYPATHGRPMPRDPRGLLMGKADKTGYTVFLPGTGCDGLYPTAGEPGSLRCKDTDDAWPVAVTDGLTQRAFYNAMRNSFTGVLTPGMNVDPGPFYEAAAMGRPNGPALLVESVDGSVALVQNGARRPIAGTRDWGSDFGILYAECLQQEAQSIVLVSGSGQAASDSLRAYALPGYEAIPVSAPLAVEGTITAMAASGHGVLAIVRSQDKLGSIHYEVLRVTAICN